MVVPTSAVELTLHFDLYNISAQQDIAEFTIWFHDLSGGPMSQFDLDNLAQNGADSWSANVPTTYWTPAVHLTYCQARTFNPDGTTLALAQKTPTAGWAGTDTSSSLPWETALCISEYSYNPGTFVANARRKRGRYYLPPMSSLALDDNNSGQIEITVLQGMLNAQKTFYNALSANPGDGDHVTPAVFSRKDSDLYEVLYLRADTKIDSQRRRQNREATTLAQVTL